MINLLFDDVKKPNVFLSNAPIQVSDHHLPSSYIEHKNYILSNENWNIYTQLSLLFKQFLDNLNIINPDEINSVSSFIYPVIMNEPYFHIRSIINNSHVDFGFWSHINPKIIESLRKKKGHIIIDISTEPCNESELNAAIEALKDCSQFPNDRIHLNLSDQRYVNNKNTHCFPSTLECHAIQKFSKLYESFDLDTNLISKKERRKIRNNTHYNKKRYLLLNNRADKQISGPLVVHFLNSINALDKGLISLDNKGNNFSEIFNESIKNYSNITHEEIPNLSNYVYEGLYLSKAMESVDFNIVVETHLNRDVFDWPLITEKIFRNVSYDMPFIVLGPPQTLYWFRQLGYSTFHPYIDESYDEINNDFIRIKSALKEISKLIALSDTEMKKFKNKCKPIHEKNKQNFLNRQNELKVFLTTLGCTF